MADEVVIDIQNALGREPQWWDPVDGMHFGEKWVFSGFLGIDFKGNDNNNALFTVAVLQIILSIFPALIACVRSCLCREKSHLGETALSGICSFLGFLGALLVILAFKCNALILLQIGVGCAMFVVVATIFEIVALVFLFLKQCRDTEGINIGSRICLVFAFVLQVLSALVTVIFCIMIVVHGFERAYDSDALSGVTDAVKNVADEVSEKAKETADSILEN